MSSKALHLQAPGIFGSLLQLQQLRTAQRRRDAFPVCHRTLPRRGRSGCPHATASDRRPLIGECTNQHKPTNCNRPNKQNTSTKQTEHYYLSQSILWSPFADGDQLDDRRWLLAVSLELTNENASAIITRQNAICRLKKTVSR